MESKRGTQANKQASGPNELASGRLAGTLDVWGMLGSTAVPPSTGTGGKPKGKTRADLAANQLPTILARWAALGSELLNTSLEAEWQPAERMVEAMCEWSELQKQTLQTVLQESCDRLSPFGDPLRVDFGAHRWLENKREESYSDWLAWIVGEVKEADLIFRLFGIADDAAVAAARRAVFREPDREVWILEHTRRLDLVIRFEPAVLIVVEVKVVGADSAETAKQEDYYGWMRGESEPIQHAILLATKADKEEYEKFHPVSWRHVCVELRRIVPRYVRSNPVLAAMILAFVGAVERNLLRMSLPELDAPAMLWMAQSEVFDHIRASMKGKENRYDNNE